MNTILLVRIAFFRQKAAYIRVQSGQNQRLWRHSGDTPCQGNLTFCRLRNWGCLMDHVTSLHFLLAAALLATLRLLPVCPRIRTARSGCAMTLMCGGGRHRVSGVGLLRLQEVISPLLRSELALCIAQLGHFVDATSIAGWPLSSLSFLPFNASLNKDAALSSPIICSLTVPHLVG